jgi:alpha-acetolactate decarboxylase
MKFIFILFFCLASFTFSQTFENRLYQISTIDALLAGYYDGDKTIQDIKKHGDFGLGTFNGIDGEMIVYEGIIYQAKSTGEIIKVDNTNGVPFASVNFFNSDYDENIKNIKSYEDLKTFLDQYKACKNYPCAFMIEGDFNYIETRSAPKASKPYPPLVEHITKTQNIFKKSNIKGVLIGYYLPKYFAKFNVPGYHFHFLSDEKDFGGHVLQLAIKKASLSLDRLYDIDLALLQTKEFEKGNIKIGKDDLEKVEKYNNHALDKDYYKEILNLINEEIKNQLTKMDEKLKINSKKLSSVDITSNEAFKILEKICNKNQYAYDCSTIDTQGIIRQIAPKEYSNFIGADISKQEQIIRLHKNKKPVISNAIQTVEGFQAFDLEYPIFDNKNMFIGSISILTKPDFFAEIIKPKIKEDSVEVCIMQLDGKILYDINQEEIGKYLFEDDLYKQFPSLLKVGEEIVKNKTGESEYQFLDKQMKQVVKKKILWNTIKLHGTQFRITLAYKI